ncbi:MAG: hypothetical protein AB8I58_14185 [Anaerolineales bacterium]
MHKKLFYTIATIVMIVASACKPAAEPTPDILAIQDTAVALAFTTVALTQAALPTITPVPTQPPTPAETPTPFPTLPALSTPTSQALVAPTSTETDICNLPPPSDPQGTTVQIRFVNESKGQVNLSFGMLEENDEGECGTYSFSIAPQASPVVEVLSGCYWAYAWITGNTPSIARSTQAICVTDTSQIRGITITPETVGFD